MSEKEERKSNHELTTSNFTAFHNLRADFWTTADPKTGKQTPIVSRISTFVAGELTNVNFSKSKGIPGGPNFEVALLVCGLLQWFPFAKEEIFILSVYECEVNDKVINYIFR